MEEIKLIDFNSKQGAYKKIPQILKMREEGMTYQKIGDYFGLSRSRIHYLEAIGIDKMRDFYGKQDKQTR